MALRESLHPLSERSGRRWTNGGSVENDRTQHRIEILLCSGCLCYPSSKAPKNALTCRWGAIMLYRLLAGVFVIGIAAGAMTGAAAQPFTEAAAANAIRDAYALAARISSY